MGIFGFLSKAHLDQVKPQSSNIIKIELLDKQINQQNLIIDRAEKQLDLLDKALEVYIDKEYVSRGLKERKKQEPERKELTTAINDASDEIGKLTLQKSEIELTQDKIEAEVGPIKYVAELIYGEQAQDNFDKASLEKQLERTKQKADRFKQKSRDYKKLVTQFGDFKDMSPDEIKVKLDQIYDWNDKNN
jgi:hypothetical protein